MKLIKWHPSSLISIKSSTTKLRFPFGNPTIMTQMRPVPLPERRCGCSPREKKSLLKPPANMARNLETALLSLLLPCKNCKKPLKSCSPQHCYIKNSNTYELAGSGIELGVPQRLTWQLPSPESRNQSVSFKKLLGNMRLATTLAVCRTHPRMSWFYV